MKVFQVCYVFFKQMKALWCHWRCWKIRCDGWIWQESGPGDVPCHKGVHEHWTIDRVLDCQRSTGRSCAGCKFVSIERNSYKQTSGRVCWRLQRYWQDERGASGFACRPCDTACGTASQKGLNWSWSWRNLWPITQSRKYTNLSVGFHLLK